MGWPKFVLVMSEFSHYPFAVGCLGWRPVISAETLALGERRGRGALTNVSGRFEAERRIRADSRFDFAADAAAPDEPPPPLATTVTAEACRTIITRNRSPDLGFDRSINAYRGCEHGCAYCYARPTHAYLGLSPGLDFESRLFAKPDAARALERELSHPGYECRMIALGTNTDPYQPIERQLEITRQILEVLAAANHPVGITTKSALVERDLDILGPMAERNLVRVFLSVTTLDRRLARRMEPRASTPAKRLETIRALAEAGIPAGVMVAPVIPGLTDSEMERILEAAAWAGAEAAAYVLLRLPLEVKDLFREWLRENEPLRAGRVMTLVRQTRDGKLNDSTFHLRGRGRGAYADLIARRFRLATRRLGLNAEQRTLDTSAFRPPPGAQLKLI